MSDLVVSVGGIDYRIHGDLTARAPSGSENTSNALLATVSGATYAFDGNCTAEQISFPSGDGQWHGASVPVDSPFGSSEPFNYKANGVPDIAIILFHRWGGSKDQFLDAEHAGIASGNNAVYISPDVGGPQNHPGCAGHPDQMMRTKACLDAVRAMFPSATKLGIAGYSGGGLLTYSFMAAYPDLFDWAIAWYGIYDLVQWHADRPSNEGESLEQIFGGPPNDTYIRDYLKQSPRWTLESLATSTKTRKVLHVSASGDSVTPPWHQLSAHRRMQGIAGLTSTFQGIGGGHTWGAGQSGSLASQIASIRA